MKWRSLVRSVQPVVEPVSLAEAKAHLRVDSEAEDELILALIQAAREWVEVYLDRTLITTQWTMKMDSFPTMARQLSEAYVDRTFIATQQSVRADIFPPDIELPRPPMSRTTTDVTISYVTAEGVSTTLSTSLYRVDRDSTPGVVRPPYAGTWPVHRVDQNAVSISWYAGYGDSGDKVPRAIRHAMLMLASFWWEHRGAVLTGSISKEIEFGVYALLNSQRWGNYQ